MSRKILMTAAGVGMVATGSLYAIKKLMRKTNNTSDTDISDINDDENDFKEEGSWKEVPIVDDSDYEELSFPTMPKLVSDEKMDACRAALKSILSGETKWKDYSSKERKIIECLLYDKLRALPEDPHANSDIWFIAKNLYDFSGRMRTERPIVYERLIYFYDNDLVPTWAKLKIVQLMR